MALVELETITSAEAAALSKRGNLVGLVPLAAIEQHGPHLPLSTDLLIAEHLGREVGRRLDASVVMVPVLQGGLSGHHLSFPGTVDLDPATIEGYVSSYVDVLVRLGVSDVYLFSSHGGNFAFLEEVAARQGQLHPNISVSAYADLPRYLEVMRSAARSAGLEVPGSDIHAGGLETSQMMYLLGDTEITAPPDLEGFVGTDDGWLEVVFEEGVGAVSPTGVLGDVRGASADVGAAVCEALVAELSAWVADSLGNSTGSDEWERTS